MNTPEYRDFVYFVHSPNPGAVEKNWQVTVASLSISSLPHFLFFVALTVLVVSSETSQMQRLYMCLGAGGTARKVEKNWERCCLTLESSLGREEPPR